VVLGVVSRVIKVAAPSPTVTKTAPETVAADAAASVAVARVIVTK
jgi:hypothetical protein